MLSMKRNKEQRKTEIHFFETEIWGPYMYTCTNVYVRCKGWSHDLKGEKSMVVGMRTCTLYGDCAKL